MLFSLGGSFLYYADRFKIYSAFCASHTKVPKVLAKGKKPADIPDWHQAHSHHSLLLCAVSGIRQLEGASVAEKACCFSDMPGSAEGELQLEWLHSEVTIRLAACAMVLSRHIGKYSRVLRWPRVVPAVRDT